MQLDATHHLNHYLFLATRILKKTLSIFNNPSQKTQFITGGIHYI